MQYEVVERSGEWVVRSRGVELARFGEQSAALEDVSLRLRQTAAGGAVSFAMRFEARR